MRKPLVLVWVLSLAIAAAISAVATAQIRNLQPRVLSGGDVGFRVEGQREEMRTDQITGERAPVSVLTGQLVVRVSGQWVEAEIAGGRIRPATH